MIKIRTESLILIKLLFVSKTGRGAPFPSAISILSEKYFEVKCFVMEDITRGQNSILKEPKISETAERVFGNMPTVEASG